MIVVIISIPQDQQVLLIIVGQIDALRDFSCRGVSYFVSAAPEIPRVTSIIIDEKW